MQLFAQTFTMKHLYGSFKTFPHGCQADNVVLITVSNCIIHQNMIFALKTVHLLSEYI